MHIEKIILQRCIGPKNIALGLATLKQQNKTNPSKKDYSWGY